MRARHLYHTRVHHRRLIKPLHKLSYRVAYLAFDLNDRVALNKALKRTPYSVQAQDYGFDNWQMVSQTIRQRALKTSPEATGAITLITLPRLFGRGFNPISLFLVHDSDDQPVSIIYDVRNTFGHRHYYAAALNGGRHDMAKQMHVSPFLDNEGHYRFNFQMTEERLHLGITKIGNTGAELYARMVGTPAPLSRTQLWRTALTMPFQGIGILVGIHWEAMKLWAKGAHYHPYKQPDDGPMIDTPTPQRH